LQKRARPLHNDHAGYERSTCRKNSDEALVAPFSKKPAWSARVRRHSLFLLLVQGRIGTGVTRVGRRRRGEVGPFLQSEKNGHKNQKPAVGSCFVISLGPPNQEGIAPPAPGRKVWDLARLARVRGPPTIWPRLPTGSCRQPSGRPSPRQKGRARPSQTHRGRSARRSLGGRLDRHQGSV